MTVFPAKTVTHIKMLDCMVAGNFAAIAQP